MQSEIILHKFREAFRDKRAARGESDVRIGEVGGVFDGDVEPIPAAADYGVQDVILFVQVDVQAAVYV